jgi:hypothetical protein
LVRLALKFVIYNEGDFMDLILSYKARTERGHILCALLEGFRQYKFINKQ